MQIFGYVIILRYLHRHIKVVKPVSEDDCVVHLVYKTLEHEVGELPKDFVLLASKRKMQGNRLVYNCNCICMHKLLLRFYIPSTVVPLNL